MNAQSLRLTLYLSAPQPCSYLAGQEAQSLFADPQGPMDTRIYGQLVQRGFRRGGHLVYRPRCPECQQCRSARVPVATFRPRRRHRRVLRANRDLRIVPVPPAFREEHFTLYRRYTRARHAGGSMADSSAQEYMDFLVADWCTTDFLEIRLSDQLLGVAVTDRLTDGLSAVYTFFDPDQPGRSLGTWAILAQIERARELGLPWLYLGYWIRDCEKMRYKTGFRPIELYDGQGWCRFEAGETVELQVRPGDGPPAGRERHP